MRGFDWLARSPASERGAHRRGVLRARRPLLVLGVACSLAGCFAIRPPQNLPFRRIGDLAELDGTYVNHGDSGKSEGSTYLSGLIWRTMRTDHRTIDAIEVRSAGDSALSLRAVAGGTSVSETTLVRGKDFRLVKGRLSIRHGCGFPIGPDTPGLFVTHGTIEFGLDRAGNGKYQNRGEILGLVFMVVPIVGHGSTEARFRRLTP